MYSVYEGEKHGNECRDETIMKTGLIQKDGGQERQVYPTCTSACIGVGGTQGWWEGTEYPCALTGLKNFASLNIKKGVNWHIGSCTHDMLI